MSEEPQGKPKIIVDDDWKERVQAEKEALQDEPDEGPVDNDAAGSIPPASFPMLLSSIATQALLGLGQIPDPTTGKPIVRPDLAKHHIDMLAVIEEKTAGNLSDEESKMLIGTLHELRMMYVSATGSGGIATPPAE